MDEKYGDPAFISNDLPPVYMCPPEDYPQHSGQAFPSPPNYSRQNFGDSDQQPCPTENEIKFLRNGWPDDSEFRCLCNTHVHKGVIALSVISIIITICESIFSVFGRRGISIYMSVGSSTPTICVYLLLLIGNRRKIKWLYWPYFILHPLILAFYFFIGVVCLVAAISISTTSKNIPLTMENDNKIEGKLLEETEVFLYAIAVLFLILFLFGTYSYLVVIRSFRYLTRVLLNPHSDLPRI